MFNAGYLSIPVILFGGGILVSAALFRTSMRRKGDDRASRSPLRARPAAMPRIV